MNEPTVKYCPDVDHEGDNPLPIDKFGKETRRRDGRRPWCRKCEARRRARRYQADPERLRGYSTRWRMANPEQHRAMVGRWEESNPDSHRERSRRHRRRARDRILDHYGRSCACCGTTEDLAIDHIDGNGAEHRTELFGKSRGTGSTLFHRWLIEQGFPPGFQTLCRPCNTSKGDGECCRLNHQE